MARIAISLVGVAAVGAALAFLRPGVSTAVSGAALGAAPGAAPGPATAAVDTYETPAFGVKDRGVFADLDGQVKVRVPSWVGRDDTSVIVDKERRTLTLYFRDEPVKTYPIALGFTPKGHKQREGDGKTPEGTYAIIEALDAPPADRYGARALRIDYPRPRDAQRGLRNGLVDRATAQRIETAHGAGEMTPQTTPLGGSIRIHGGGAGEDWTLGCLGMRDADVVELYRHVKVGTSVTILPYGRRQKADRDGDGIPDGVDILVGAKKTVLNGAAYRGGYEKLAYPGGDVPRTRGVCTDVLVRAIRNAGLDLQKEVHEDILKRRKTYGRRVKRPDPNIDQRRVKTIIVYFRKFWRSLPVEIDRDRPQDWLPGDIVFFDTFPERHGPDHVGILSDTLGAGGFPLVINNWTDGSVTSEMDLLGWVPVTHRFRTKARRR